jgi:hypothetical protein
MRFRSTSSTARRQPSESTSPRQGAQRVASAIIIASCIKENDVLKELKCAAPTPLTARWHKSRLSAR